MEQLEKAAVDTIGQLRAAGIPVVLLKGAATAAWLYTDFDTPRVYGDVDLLVHPDDVVRAGDVLEELGFVAVYPVPDDSDLAGMLHSQEWSGHVPLDLHWRLPGVTIDPAEAWEIWRTGEAVLPLAGRHVETLGEDARALHLALHVAQRGASERRAVADLERGIAQLPFALWQRTVTLAHAVSAIPALSAGLHTTPTGSVLADELALPRPTIYHRLRTRDAGRIPRGPVRLLRFLGAGDWQTRAAILRGGLFPSPTQLRATYPIARRGRRGALAARVKHLLLAPVRVGHGVWILVRAARRRRLRPNAAVALTPIEP